MKTASNNALSASQVQFTHSIASFLFNVIKIKVLEEHLHFDELISGMGYTRLTHRDLRNIPLLKLDIFTFSIVSWNWLGPSK